MKIKYFTLELFKKIYILFHENMSYKESDEGFFLFNIINYLKFLFNYIEP